LALSALFFDLLKLFVDVFAILNLSLLNAKKRKKTTHIVAGLYDDSVQAFEVYFWRFGSSVNCRQMWRATNWLPASCNRTSNMSRSNCSCSSSARRN